VSRFADYFSSVAAGYATYRPGYPDALFDWLATLPSRRELAWDCAAGSGQATIGLAARFQRVIATDASPDQLEAMPQLVNMERRAGRAEAAEGIGSGSVDLVTVAQALHWFDFHPFYREARRVLRPGGAIAVWTYGSLTLNDPPLDAIIGRFEHETMGPWWPPERRLIEQGYATIPFPFEEIPTPQLEMTVEWPLNRLVGYIATWSALARFRSAHSDRDPLRELVDQLGPVWGPPDEHRWVRWPLTIRAGRPHP
jgi:SAM-dependent methyltransferase